MTYEKPELLMLTPAIAAVQGTEKGVDAPDHEPSTSAYVADE